MMEKQKLLYLAEKLKEVSNVITEAVESKRKISKKETNKYMKMLMLVGEEDKEKWFQTPVEHIEATKTGRFRYKGREKYISMPTRMCNKPIITYGTHSKRYTVNVMRLMYDTFIRKTDLIHECVIPKDGNMMNLKLENLMVMTRKKRMEEVMTISYSKRINVEATLEKVAIAKEEVDLAVYYATTGEWDRYNKYIEDKLYGRLVEYGLHNLDRKGKIWVMNAVDETISEIYSIIDSNRGITNITDLCKKIMREKARQPHVERHQLKSCEKPVDNPAFEYLAVKYGLIDSYRD